MASIDSAGDSGEEDGKAEEVTGSGVGRMGVQGRSGEIAEAGGVEDLRERMKEEEDSTSKPSELERSDGSGAGLSMAKRDVERTAGGAGDKLLVSDCDCSSWS